MTVTEIHPEPRRGDPEQVALLLEHGILAPECGLAQWPDVEDARTILAAAATIARLQADALRDVCELIATAPTDDSAAPTLADYVQMATPEQCAVVRRLVFMLNLPALLGDAA